MLVPPIGGSVGRANGSDCTAVAGLGVSPRSIRLAMAGSPLPPVALPVDGWRTARLLAGGAATAGLG